MAYVRPAVPPAGRLSLRPSLPRYLLYVIFTGVGVSMMAVQTFSTIYYQILVTYILYYLFASMTDGILK